MKGAEQMSRNELSVRLVGDLPPPDELREALGVAPTADRRRGMPPKRGRPPLEVDVWSLVLIERSQWAASAPNEEAERNAADVLHRMAPGLAALDRSRCRAELYISSIRDDEQGGFGLSPDVIVEAGAGGLELAVSILVMWPDDDEWDSGDDAGSDDGDGLGGGDRAGHGDGIQG